MNCLGKMAAFGSLAALALSAEAFAQARPGLDAGGIRKFLDDLVAYQPSRSPADNEIVYVQRLLKVGRSVINSAAGVMEFNRQNKQNPVAVIGKLADISTIDVPDIRVNSTLILVDVTENRTVCAVLNKLLEQDLADKSRFNLLQVVKVVSSRVSNVDVKSWTTAMLAQNRTWIQNLPNMEKTRSLLADIERNLGQKQVTDKLERDHRDEYRECMELGNIRRLPRP